MKARVAALALVAVLAPFATEGQQPSKVYLIGVLSPFSAPARDSSGAGHMGAVLVGALRSSGWIEGQNLRLEYRFADNDTSRLPALAAELVRLRADVIVTITTPATLAAKRATSDIPVIFAAVGDPVGTGLVASLARPEGNLTGLSSLMVDLDAKRLELLKEIAPRLSRVAVVYNPDNPIFARRLEQARVAARSLGVTLQEVELRKVEELDAVLDRLARDRPDALTFLADSRLLQFRERIAAFAIASRLPLVSPYQAQAQAGGLAAYGPDYADLFRRAAIYVDKVLKGAKPSELPVEQPEKLHLVINLKTARTLGLTIPPSLLLRADQVIQ